MFNFMGGARPRRSAERALARESHRAATAAGPPPGHAGRRFLPREESSAHRPGGHRLRAVHAGLSRGARFPRGCTLSSARASSAPHPGMRRQQHRRPAPARGGGGGGGGGRPSTSASSTGRAPSGWPRASPSPSPTPKSTLRPTSSATPGHRPAHPLAAALLPSEWPSAQVLPC